MDPDEEDLNKIVSEQADKIQSEAIEQIKHIQEASEKSLNRIVPDLMNMIESFSVFKMLDVLDIIRNGGMVKTGECEVQYDNTAWSFQIGSTEPFYGSHPYRRLGKGRYRITLLMEKIVE